LPVPHDIEGSSTAADRDVRDALDLVRLEPPTAWEQLLRWWRTTSLAVVLGGAATAAVVGLVAWIVLRPEPPPAEDVVPMATRPTASPAPATTSPAHADAPVVVHVAGAVVVPGLYELAGGARVADAIEAARGATPEADLDRLNLAQPLVDGSRVYVPRAGETDPPEVLVPGSPPGSVPSPEGTVVAGPVDLNTATLEQLDELPGVGPTTAQAIIDHREQNGPFRSVDELLDVRGIGDAKLAQLRPLVTVG
jgi:competence protein ComEA